jgi:hypothetical protein
MCVSCGCGEPNDAHGDMRNITMDDLNRAAEAAGISPSEAAQNIADASQRMGGTTQSQHGQMGGYEPGTGHSSGTSRRGYEQEDIDRI